MWDGEKNNRADGTVKSREERVVEQRNACQWARESAHKAGKSLCPHCDFTGMILAEEDKTGAKHTFRCTFCTAAEQLSISRFIPSWGANFSERFKILKAGFG